jgi:hypothetical protein
MPYRMIRQVLPYGRVINLGKLALLYTHLVVHFDYYRPVSDYVTRIDVSATTQAS